MSQKCSMFIGPWRSLAYSHRAEILEKVRNGSYALLLMTEPVGEKYTTMECIDLLMDVYREQTAKGLVRIRPVMGTIESIYLC
jgi:hypothetical protein